MAQVIYTIRGRKAFEWAASHPSDPLFIEPPNSPDDGSRAKGVRVGPTSPEAKRMLTESPSRLACNVMD